MNWYIAKIIFQIRISGYPDSQFDIQQRLISAGNSENALQKARHIALKEEDVFINEKNETVTWKLAGISELHLLPALHDGLQLHSSTLETDDPENFLRHIQQAEISCQPLS